ncbi:SusC/RagA family TonB-linked outer membrane protein [Halosquirtibacter laminarini]|uniref:SusC/RagA family TonB-linked outer membrane protein n=1 Tax=Halosquirtibacter laminarini TaxID=3374600 RepID=A0AC61NHU2_9BACT|nr:SusC/RagA family TonB-linked outer membrane protein [Prolixibacteraceae bacterium]
MGNLFAEFKLVKDLTFKTSASYTYTGKFNKNNRDSFDLGAAVQDYQEVSRNFGYGSNILIENTLNYDLSIGKSTIKTTLGQSFQEYESDNLNVSSFYQDNGHYIVSAYGAELPQITNNVQDYAMSSYFGRLFFDWDQRFLVTANLRADGSSRFGENNRWGVFPSASAAWRVSQEEFFPQEGIISSLKLRGGWGQVGNNEIGNYPYSAAMISGSNYPFGDTSGAITIGVAAKSIPNADVKWETVTQYSFGFDAYLFDNKLSLVAEYFNKNHSDMLVPVQQSGVTGISSDYTPGEMIQNIAELSNSGIELSLNYSNNIGKWNYSIGGNITTFNNEVKNVGGKGYYETFPFFGSYIIRTQEGHELGEFYGYVNDGIFQVGEAEKYTSTAEDGTVNRIQPNAEAGDLRFKDLNNDGKIDDQDRDFIGSPVPDFTYALNAEVSYGNLSLSLAFNGVYGVDIANLTKRTMIDPTSGGNKMNYTPWSTQNPTSQYFRAHPNDPNKNIRFSDYFVEDGSFLRCSLIQLGYEMPKSFTNALHLSRCRIYGSVKNPFVLTNYSGVDPEVGAGNGSNLESGIDRFLYPSSRTFTIGVNISL